MKMKERRKPNGKSRKKRNLGQHGCTIAIREGFMAIAVTLGALVGKNRDSAKRRPLSRSRTCPVEPIMHHARSCHSIVRINTLVSLLLSTIAGPKIGNTD